jgi:predicted nucleotidyltransferase component of viral defense system
MTTPLEQSFKKRLQNIAKDRNVTPAEIWQNMISERFLVRLCKSSYHSHFIFKGGSLLAKHVELGRETKDLDFTIEHLDNQLNILQKVFEDITQIEIDDGFTFAKPLIVPLEHFHMQYPGAQVKIEVNFGKSKFPLFVDLGFGDMVKVREEKIFLLSTTKGPLFESSVTLKCYPMEFVFAEKLETVIHRGGDNSRMKDFHDLYTLVSTKGVLNGVDVESALKAVFNHRKTPLSLPFKLDLFALESLQTYWVRYRQSLVTNSLPNQVDQIFETINNWLILNTKML